MTTFLWTYVIFSGLCCFASLLGLASGKELVITQGVRVASLVVSLGFIFWAVILLTRAA